MNVVKTNFFARFVVGYLVSSASFAAEVTPAGKPLPLRESIQLALKNNHDVLRAAHEVDAAQSQLSSARSQFFPKLELEMDGGTFHDRLPQPGDTKIPLAARDRNKYTAQLNLSQSIFSGFQTSSTISRYNAAERVKALGLQIAKEKVIEDTIGLYFGVQLLEKQIQAEKEVQVLRENQQHEVDERAHHGNATDLQQLQALYAVKQQVPKIQLLEMDLSSRRLKLYRNLNLPLDGVYQLSDPLPDNVRVAMAAKIPTLPEALEFGLLHSLRIQQLEAQFQALQAQSSETLAVHLPSLNLQLSAGTDAYQRQDIASTDSLTYGAQLVLKVPLFSGLDSFSDRSYWQSRLDELKEERAKLRETLLDDLNETYRRLEMTTNSVEASRVNLDLTERAVRRARDFYRMGRSTLPDVLNAYSANLEAKKQSTQDTYDRIVALFHIKSLLGLGATFEDTNG